MDPRQIGIRLATRRRATGLTQAALARRMGTTQSAVSRVEAGRVLPTLELLERFANATGRPLTITLGAARQARPASRAARRARVRRALGGYVFDPWERGPSDAEARTLEKDDLTRERFKRSTAAPGRRG